MKWHVPTSMLSVMANIAQINLKFELGLRIEDHVWTNR